MRVLLAIVVLLALGWSGWWWWNATSRQSGVESWLADRRADGWVAEAGDIAVTGFPNRVDLKITDLELTNPEPAWSWMAEEFEILSLSYKPHHVIAVWPGEQIVASPYERVLVESALMRGSLVFEPNPSLTLDRTTIEIDDMMLKGETGWEARLGEALFAVRQSESETADHAYDLNFNADLIVPPRGWLSAVERSGVLPETIETARIDATVVFDRPLDRQSVEGDAPGVEEVRLRDASITWGELDLRGQGTLRSDADGYLEGKIDVRARNWREMIDLAEAAGALPDGIGGALRAGLDLLALISGSGDSLTAPLVFEDGRVKLGPVVIGDAPRLGIR